MHTSQIVFQESIAASQERTYFEHSFSVPEHVCRIDISYAYQRYAWGDDCDAVTRREINIVDLALRDGSGNYVGASGAGRDHIYVSGAGSSAGYAQSETAPGMWAVIIGAYKIAPAGVAVTYTITFTYSERVLLKGDTHVHSLASDGKLSREQLVGLAEMQGLDFFFLTDHNDYAQNNSPAQMGTVSVFPGSEWTHYEGHAGMLGLCRPIQSPFCVNSKEAAWEKLAEAKSNGALVVINHPFCPNCGWHFGLESDCFDLIEVWNGGTATAANRACLTWWHQQLCRGKRYPIIAGSDFHRMSPSAHLGQPTTAVYAKSRSLSHVLEALRCGNSYMKVCPNAPDLSVRAAGAILGESAPRGSPVSIRLTGLSGNEVLRIYTDLSSEDVLCAESVCDWHLVRAYSDAAFVRFELWKDDTLLLLSNPIYFT